MTKLEDLVELLISTKNKFIAVCTNANRDLPFHDYEKVEIEPEEEQE